MTSARQARLESVRSVKRTAEITVCSSMEIRLEKSGVNKIAIRMIVSLLRKFKKRQQYLYRITKKLGNRELKMSLETNQKF